MKNGRRKTHPRSKMRRANIDFMHRHEKSLRQSGEPLNINYEVESRKERLRNVSLKATFIIFQISVFMMMICSVFLCIVGIVAFFTQIDLLHLLRNFLFVGVMGTLVVICGIAFIGLCPITWAMIIDSFKNCFRNKR